MIADGDVSHVKKMSAGSEKGGYPIPLIFFMFSDFLVGGFNLPL
jgi:hypothetical protein